MALRHRPHRVRVSLLVVGVVVGSVMAVGPAGIAGAALSDDDCETLLSAETNSSSSNNELENLADQADTFEATADDISDRKLKKAMLRLASVYSEASKAKNAAGAGVVMVQRAKVYAKGYKVYAKSLTKCQMQTYQ